MPYLDINWLWLYVSIVIIANLLESAWLQPWYYSIRKWNGPKKVMNYVSILLDIYRSVQKLKTFVNKLLYIFDSNMVCMLHHSATSFTIMYLSTTAQFPKTFLLYGHIAVLQSKLPHDTEWIVLYVDKRRATKNVVNLMGFWSYWHVCDMFRERFLGSF